jgi:hypothetical protein
MIDFLNALKADLLDRRLMPFVALAACALLGAIAYVAIGSGSSSTPTPTAAVAPATPSAASGSHLAVSQSTPEKASAETTEGASTQHHGIARDPFTPLPSTNTTKSSTAPSSTGISSSGTSAASTPAKTESKASTPTTPSKPSTPAKPKTVYHVAVLFGVVPAGSTPGSTPPTVQLTPYENLKLLTPLPSSQQPLIVFRGVTVGGHTATFTVVGEVILHGSANCLPNASQCQAIDLIPGQSEQLEYLPPSGPAVVYELKVVSIASSKASTASVKALLRSESKAGRELLRHSGLVAIPYLHYSSSQVGVLAFVSHPAFAADAHSAQSRANGH